MMSIPDRLLRIALRCNAAFSTVCAAVALLFAEPLAATFGLPGAAALQGLGVQLLVFALFLVWLAARPRIPTGLALAVIVADLLWVAGTVPVVWGDLLTRTGDWVALGVADVVALFAVLQMFGLRRVRAAPAPA